MIYQMMENGINYTSKEIARIKKVNSDNEINRRTLQKSTNSNDNIDFNNDNIEINNITNVGTSLSINNPIILESISNTSKTKKENENNITTLKKKKKKNTKINKESQRDFIPESLSTLDFSGFSLISDMTEVIFDE